MFAQLLRNPDGRNPGGLQSEAAARFPEVVTSSPLKLRKPNDLIDESGMIILGVASYSRAELELLDQLVANVDHWDGKIAIYVFDVAACHSLEEVDQYLTGNLNVVVNSQIKQTPVLQAILPDLVATKQGLYQVKRLLAYLGALRIGAAA